MRKDYIDILVRSGWSAAKIKSIVRTQKPWTVRKIAMERQLPRVAPWRCPVHGCLLVIEECIDCKIDRSRKMDKVAKTFKDNP